KHSSSLYDHCTALFVDHQIFQIHLVSFSLRLIEASDIYKSLFCIRRIPSIPESLIISFILILAEQPVDA
ncbi:MAG TPA: hypothetical protein PLC60_04190, partial [Saprospiraceae bacterium]|nr:hypothetical protein [Saprospiraceae bacterium]